MQEAPLKLSSGNRIYYSQLLFLKFKNNLETALS